MKEDEIIQTEPMGPATQRAHYVTIFQYDTGYWYPCGVHNDPDEAHESALASIRSGPAVDYRLLCAVLPVQPTVKP